MSAENSNWHAERTVKLHNALSILDDLDHHRDLKAGIPILVFFACCGFAVLSFFIITDLILWEGVEEEVARLVITISWILIIPVWMLSFLVAMTLLDAMRFRDLQSVAEQRLSSLTLSLEEVHELRSLLIDREWRHGRIFENVVTDLADGSTRGRSSMPAVD